MLAVDSAKSLFYDKSSTHTLSDWLVPALFEREQKTNEEFVIGLPDLSDLIDRSGDRTQINWLLWRELNAYHLTSVGQRLREAVKGKSFYDLACGDLSLSVVPRLIAQGFGAQEYVGVDLYHVSDSIIQEEFPSLGSFPQRRVKMDVLSFLRDQILLSPACVLISGFEAVQDQDALTKQYLHELSSEIERKTSRGDVLVVGAGTSDIQFSARSFRSIYSDHYHEIFERRGRPFFMH